MSVEAAYTVKVDWNNDGDYDDANEDVSANVLEIPKIDRGKDKAWELGKGQATLAEVLLDNSSQIYSPENSGGALYGNIKPNRPVQIAATYGSTYNLFTGFLQDIMFETRMDKRMAKLVCEDGLTRLRRQNVTIKVYKGITTGVAIGYILDAVGWPAGARRIDAGQTTLTYWWLWNKPALTAIRELEETELGLAYIDEDGSFVFEDRHHKLKAAHLTSQETYGVSDRIYHNFRYDRRVRDVYNIAQVNINIYSEGSTAILWTLDEEPYLAPGETRMFRTVFTSGAVDLVSPVATTDYTANSQSGGGGTDLTADIAVVMTDLGQGSDLELTNNSGQIAYITLLQQRGKLISSTTKSIEAENTTSQDDYDKRSYPLPGAWIPSENVGKDYCDFVVQHYGSEVPIVQLSIWNAAADDLTEILTRKVSDRITVENTELGLDAEFFVQSVKHIIKEQGRLHVMEITAELASLIGDYWVLGTSTLGETTRLCY